MNKEVSRMKAIVLDCGVYIFSHIPDHTGTNYLGQSNNWYWRGLEAQKGATSATCWSDVQSEMCSADFTCFQVSFHQLWLSRVCSTRLLVMGEGYCLTPDLWCWQKALRCLRSLNAWRSSMLLGNLRAWFLLLSEADGTLIGVVTENQIVMN